MFSSSCKALFPLFVYLSLLVALVECHDASMYARDHAMMNKRLMKKRSPFPAGDPFTQSEDSDILPPVAGAAGIPSLPVSASASASVTSASASVTSASASASQSATSASASTTASASATESASVSASVTASNASASSTAASSTASQSTQTSAAPLETLNIANASVAPSVSTIVPTFTETQSVDATPTSITAPVSGAATTDDTNTKSTTLTVIIAVAASIGGVAILWTIFRKWKLSSSKKFDQRLNPIDWQPTTGEDNAIPTHRRVPSGSSYHSGSGHGHGSRSDPLDHDFTAGPNTSPVGGYADMARGPSPPMQEHLTRGPSFNNGYNSNVPIHSQAGYGARY